MNVVENFKEKLKFSQKDFLQFYIDGALPSALLRFGTAVGQ